MVKIFHKPLRILLLVCIGLVILNISSESALSDNHNTLSSQTIPENVIIAWVEDNRPGLPDPSLMTHMTYAFGIFNETNDSVVIPKPDKLKGMVGLKETNPNLKVLLGIGGYQKEGFSEMTSDSNKRKNFIQSCLDAMKNYGIDGFALDWEFPTTTAGGHTARPDDDVNYAIFVQELRNAVGNDTWISIYSNNSAKWIDFASMVPYLTCVEVSGYNLNMPPYHQCNLYPSKTCSYWSVSKSIATHVQAGIPREKILLGIPFFGRGAEPFPSYLDCNKFDKYNENCQIIWDDAAKAPYYADSDGKLVCAFDNAESIAQKCRFVNDKGLKGVFYWNYDSDFEDHRLAKAVHQYMSQH